MSQEITTFAYNISEIYMGPLVMEYEPSVMDMGLFLDTPLELNLEERTFPLFEKSISELATIYFRESFFILKEPLQFEMTFNDGIWLINNQLLDIHVWGESMDEAIVAFNFAFYSIYKNFGTEDNNKLSRDGIELKNKIIDLILISNEG